MPKKTVWEMTAMERLHYSLSSRTFRAIIRLCLIICAAAVAFGFFLYRATVDREYRIMTWQLSLTTAEAVDQEEIRREAEEVVRLYAAAPPEEELRNVQDYLDKFSGVRTEGFEAFRRRLNEIREKVDAKAAYTAFLDIERDRMVFIADSDPAETFCPPGHWDHMTEGMGDAFLHGAKPSLLDRLYQTGPMPSVVAGLEQYGLRCTAGTRLFDVDGYPVFLFFDSDMNQVDQVSSRFLLQYVLMLLIATVLAALFSIRRMKKTVVSPINALARAADAYTRDARGEGGAGRHFAALDIRTGDEIENLSLTMKAMENDMAAYVENLAAVTAEKERIGTELSLARRIQADMLPNIFPPFPERTDLDIFASMTPAKEVGGDFYDFFLLDRDHLGMVIADVSGKGVPAALFMMVSKILVQTYALLGNSPAQVLSIMNEQFCQNNREEMFITIWFGVLDLKTGTLTAANAGHEYPVLKKPDGSFELIKDKHGFVIGGLEGMHYREYELQMDPGSKLFLYTDGVPESTDENGALFGTERMLAALRRAENAEPKEILRSVDEAARAFVGESAQFDDLTMLCVHYVGPAPEEGREVKELTVDATVNNIETVTDFINAELEAMDCPIKTQMQIDVAIDEILANVASYAYGTGSGMVTVRMITQQDPKAVILRFIDDGMPFNPLEKEEPDTSLPLEERPIGGLGIFLVRKTMDEVGYEYREGKNILQIKKMI